MDSTYPFYIVDLDGYKLITSHKCIDIPHQELWEHHVSKIVAKHYGINYNDIKELCYACYRGRISTPTVTRNYSDRQMKLLNKKGIKLINQVVFFGENNKIIKKVISKYFPNYKIKYDEHHRRQNSDIAKFTTFLNQ